jgi:hypothetical protein
VPPEIPEWFIKKVRAVTAKRARTVIDHIVEHGHITTEELRTLYGYDHPPRAARDVREQGIPLETFRIAGTHGKSIGAYRFAELSEIRAGVLAGRKVFSKQFKKLLVERSGARCAVCLTDYQSRYLQVDHCVPYQVGGEGGGEDAPEEFQLICGSCNRAKSWSCEHCANWTDKRQVKVCQACYWGNPEAHTHVALLPIRRLDVSWSGAETRDYDRLAEQARQAGLAMPDFVKAALRRRL